MSGYTVVAEVGAALVRVLWDEIQNDQQLNGMFNNPNLISLRSPYDLRTNETVRLSIYLYRIVEDAYAKNQPPPQGGGRRQRQTPLTLDLFYLVTPLVGMPDTQQIVLGKVMQVFHDRAVLQGPDLSAEMAAAGEELRIVLNPVSLQEISLVWQALEMSYRLSVCYTVRVVVVDSTRVRNTQPVVIREAEYAGG